MKKLIFFLIAVSVQLNVYGQNTSFTITKPAPGDVIYTDGTLVIEWTDDFNVGGHVYFKFDGVKDYTTSAVPNDGYQSFSSAAGLEPGGYRIWIYHEESSRWGVLNDPFIVKKSEPPIEVYRPTSSTIWTQGEENVSIKWNGVESGGDVDIWLYYKNGLDWGLIKSNTKNDGSYSWDVPINIKPGEYKVKVQKDGGNYDYSDVFEIVSYLGDIKVTNPTSSTIWVHGQQNVPIEWETGDLDGNVEIKLFKGTSTNPIRFIATATSNNGLHNTFDVPNYEPGDDYKIQITSLSHPEKSDESSYFSIVAQADLESDISITNWWTEPHPVYENQEIQICIEITNLGNTSSTQTTVSIETDGQIYNKPVEAISPGQSAIIKTAHTYYVSGGQLVECNIQPASNESNINNNSIQFDDIVVEPDPYSSLELTLYKITDLKGTPDSPIPGNDKSSFAPGEEIRLTFIIEYDQAQSLQGYIAFEIYEGTNLSQSVYDSGANEKNRFIDLNTNSGLAYYSIDLTIPPNFNFNRYHIGAAIWESDYSRVVEETYPGANTTFFETGWILMNQFEVIEKITDKDPPVIKIFRTYQTGDGSLHVIAKVTDIGSGINNDKVILKTKKLGSADFSKSADFIPIPGYPGFYEAKSHDYTGGEFILWKVSAEDNAGNKLEYPKDILDYITYPPYDEDHHDWYQRVLIKDEFALANDASFQITNNHSGAVSFKQVDGSLEIYNNTSIWYEFSAKPGIKNDPRTSFPESWGYLLEPKEGYISQLIKNIGGRSPGFTLQNIQGYNSFNIQINRKTNSAIFWNVFDMVRIAIEPGIGQIELSKLTEILVNSVEHVPGIIEIIESVEGKDYDAAVFTIINEVFSDADFQSYFFRKIYDYRITHGLLTKAANAQQFAGQLGAAISVLKGIDNRVRFLVDLFKHMDEQEIIHFKKEIPLSLRESVLPATLENQNDLSKLYAEPNQYFQMVVELPDAYQEYFNVHAEFMLYNEFGEKIAISKNNSLNEIGNVEIVFDHARALTQNGGDLKVVPIGIGGNNRQIGINFYYDFSKYNSKLDPYYFEMNLYEGGFPNSNTPPLASKMIHSSGRIPFNIFDKINPVKPSLTKLKQDINNISFEITTDDIDVYKYTIYRQIESGNFEELKTVVCDGSESTLVFDNFDEFPQSATYKVKAYDINNNQSGYSNTITFEKPTNPLQKPIANIATNVTSSGFTASWNLVSNATGYYLDVALDEIFTNYVLDFENKDVGNTTSFPVSGLNSNKIYYYRVRAYNEDGVSDYSNAIDQTTLSSVGAATLSLDNINGSAGNTISILVTATKFLNVVGFQFTINYDKTKLEYVNCSEWRGGANASGVQINNLADEGKLTFVYNDATINIQNDKFFNLNFIIKNGAEEIANLSWTDSPTLREISNSQGIEIPCNYNNGSVNIVSGYTLSGNLTYKNSAQTPLENISISLNSNSQQIGNSLTNVSGGFSFPGLSDGPYTFTSALNLPWGGATAMDITLYKKHIGNVQTLSELQIQSGDVNENGSLTSMDLTIIKQRIGAARSSFDAVRDWAYSPKNVTINGKDLVQNIQALCYGDANGSYTPISIKSASNIFSSLNDCISILNNGEINIPFTVNKSLEELSSVTIIMKYPYDILDISSLEMVAHNEDLYYTVIDGTIRIIYSTLNSLDLKPGDLLMTLRLYLKPGIQLNSLSDQQLKFSGYGEFGDYGGHVLNGVMLNYTKIKSVINLENEAEKDFKIYPNPARDYITIEKANSSKISIVDIYGREILIINSISDSEKIDLSKFLTGNYVIKIITNNQVYSKKIVLIR